MNRKIGMRISSIIVLLIIIASLMACSKAEATDPTPYEFTLLLATNNNGEVGPCG